MGEVFTPCHPHPQDIWQCLPIFDGHNYVGGAVIAGIWWVEAKDTIEYLILQCTQQIHPHPTKPKDVNSAEAETAQQAMRCSPQVKSDLQGKNASVSVSPKKLGLEA